MDVLHRQLESIIILVFLNVNLFEAEQSIQAVYIQ